MKLDLFETHDRYEFFTKQDHSISECCQDLIDKRPFGNFPFYIFAHARTIDEYEKTKLWMSGKYKNLQDLPSKVILWQPRLTKPKAQTNSMLFKTYPGTDRIDIIWMIPDRDLWPEYSKGKITQSDIVNESIHNFLHKREELEKPDPDDLPESKIESIYKEMALDKTRMQL